MMYMLYCIFRDSGPDSREPVAGIAGEPVSVISANGLSAAISRVSPAELTPDANRALAYHRVVEAFHQDRTVIPMRYGSVYEEEARIVRFLEKNEKKLNALLDELDGCVEMGIRILLPEFDGSELHSHEEGYAAADTASENAVSEEPDVPGTFRPSVGAGHEYLRKRRKHYGLDEILTRRRDAMVEHCRQAFQAHYVKMKREDVASEIMHLGSDRTGTAARGSLLSLYFLVPKSSIEPFRLAFRDLSSRESAKLLLSGPWAPYNFVTDLVPEIGNETISHG
jgi:hypothetical protein